MHSASQMLFFFLLHSFKQSWNERTEIISVVFVESKNFYAKITRWFWQNDSSKSDILHIKRITSKRGRQGRSNGIFPFSSEHQCKMPNKKHTFQIIFSFSSLRVFFSFNFYFLYILIQIFFSLAFHCIGFQRAISNKRDYMPLAQKKIILCVNLFSVKIKWRSTCRLSETSGDHDTTI